MKKERNPSRSLIKFYFLENHDRIVSDDEFERNKEQLLEQYVTEVLSIEDSDEFDVVKDGNTFSKNLNIQSEKFKVEIIPINSKPNFFKFSFKLVKSLFVNPPEKPKNDEEIKSYLQNLTNYEYGLTNTGNAIKVMKVVKSVLFRFIKVHQPDGVVIQDFDEGERNGVYTHVCKDVGKKTNYKFSEQNNVFLLVK